MTFEDNMDFVEAFEQKICGYTGFKYATCVDCCTNGILLALESMTHKDGLNKDECVLQIPRRTYMSVPMTLKNNGWKIRLVDAPWLCSYRISPVDVYDAATDFHENMAAGYKDGDIVCVSFQQKKRLPLGRGGAVLYNDGKYDGVLKRLRYDGRNPRISDRTELLENPGRIMLGYHCYMEPDKAARGILMLNQPGCMKAYARHSSDEYEDLVRIEGLFR